MTIEQKREIVRRFKAGTSVGGICLTGPPVDILNDRWPSLMDIEQVLRDFMLGKFTLEPKRRKARLK